LLKNDSWKGKIYEACDANVSQESILWPEMFSQQRLMEIRTMYSSARNLQGFNMEYRNIATDQSSGFFRKEDFRSMTDEDRKKIDDGRLTYYVGGDFAISTKQRRDRTVFVVGGMDADGALHVVDVRAGQWDGLQIIEEMFSIYRAWHPDEWYLESGSILKTLQGALEVEQRKHNIYLPLSLMVPVNDKQRRAVSMQARMRARAVRFDKDTSWYAHLEEECLSFPRGEHDDYVDALAWLGVGLSRMVTPATDEEEEEIEFENMKRESMTFGSSGRSLWTGY
jgi:predicted phage terminase large subunit-like protein